MRSPLDTLHTPIVLSLDPDAKYSPFGENTTLKTRLMWPARVLMCSPLDIFHTAIEESKEPETKYSPFSENTTVKIGTKESVKVLTSSQFDTPTHRFP